MDMAADLSEKYGVPVMPVNCLEMTEEEIKDIISKVLFEFPVREIAVDMPHWITSLEGSHNLRDDLFGTIKSSCGQDRAHKRHKLPYRSHFRL